MFLLFPYGFSLCHHGLDFLRSAHVRIQSIKINQNQQLSMKLNLENYQYFLSIEGGWEVRGFGANERCCLLRCHQRSDSEDQARGETEYECLNAALW